MNRAMLPVLISTFPDRDTADENYSMTIALVDARSRRESVTIPIRVVDQDQDGAGVFNVTVDFSKDKTGFFNDPHKRRIVQQAVDDWAYFIGDMKLDTILAGAESTLIWNSDGFVSNSRTLNANSYQSFLLYAYGINSSAQRSGGEGSHVGGFQSSNGRSLPIRRSGGFEAEMKGNYNALGWFLTTGDDDWWRTGNLRNETNDFYSIAHHEIGHALCFNPAYTRVASFKTKGRINDAAVFAYQDANPRIDASDHLHGQIDRASRKGAFGYEYYGEMPRRRWIITKLDLLCAQAIGYALRPTSAFVLLSMSPVKLESAKVSSPYRQQLSATGGIPFYFWEITDGVLPEGLTLDSFTGTISGVPRSTGTSIFTVRVRDYTEAVAGSKKTLSIAVVPPSK